MWNLEGKRLRAFPECTRLQDMAVSKNGRLFVCLGGDAKVRLYDLNGSDDDCGVIEYKNTKVAAITLSQDGSKLLVSA